jgi:ferredoxin
MLGPHQLSTLMAALTDRLTENILGKYYVDASCIDCDQCRSLAPQFFLRHETTGLSIVHTQPVTPEDCALVEQIREDCASSSIGNDGNPS